MLDNIFHKHMIIRAEVSHPLTTEKELKKWLRNLVKTIDMNIVGGPYAKYVTKEGNRGVTGVVMIETSHISIHIWDEEDPSLVQCDVYSCANYSTAEVLQHFRVMEPTKIEYMLLDREKELSCKKSHVHTHEPGVYYKV